MKGDEEMKDVFNANISHSFFYTTPYSSVEDYVALVKKN